MKSVPLWRVHRWPAQEWVTGGISESQPSQTGRWWWMGWRKWVLISVGFSHHIRYRGWIWMGMRQTHLMFLVGMESEVSSDCSEIMILRRCIFLIKWSTSHGSEKSVWICHAKPSNSVTKVILRDKNVGTLIMPNS